MNQATLGEIADQSGGVIQTGPFGSQIHSYDYVDAGVPVVMPQDIVQNRIDLKKIAYIQPSLANSLKRHYLRSGDIVFPRRGDIGKCAIFEESSRLMFCGTGCLKISIPEKTIYPKWLFYYLLQEDVIKSIENNAVGSTMLNLNTGILRAVDIVYPKLSTQKKIASILSNYDDFIQINQQRITLLEEAAQRLYDEWFVKLRFPNHEQVPVVDGVPEGWAKFNLFDVFDVGYGYPFKASLFNENKQGTPAIRIRDIQDMSTKTYTTEEVDENYWVKCGDFLIGMDGMFHMNYWPYDKAYLVQRVCRIRPIDPKYFGLVKPALKEPIKYYESTIAGATVAHLGAKHLKEIFLTLPKNPPDWVNVLNELASQQLFLHQQNQKLMQARDELLSRLMSGQLDVSTLSHVAEV